MIDDYKRKSDPSAKNKHNDKELKQTRALLEMHEKTQGVVTERHRVLPKRELKTEETFYEAVLNETTSKMPLRATKLNNSDQKRSNSSDDVQKSQENDTSVKISLKDNQNRPCSASKKDASPFLKNISGIHRDENNNSDQKKSQSNYFQYNPQYTVSDSLSHENNLNRFQRKISIQKQEIDEKKKAYEDWDSLECGQSFLDQIKKDEEKQLVHPETD